MPKIDLKDIATADEALADQIGKDIGLLGFFRVAISFIRQIEELDENQTAAESELKDKIVVVDFNPDVHAGLKALGVKAIYGDVSHMGTLHHAGIHFARVVLSTIPDTILVGTDNLRMIKQEAMEKLKKDHLSLS